MIARTLFAPMRTKRLRALYIHPPSSVKTHNLKFCAVWQQPNAVWQQPNAVWQQPHVVWQQPHEYTIFSACFGRNIKEESKKKPDIQVRNPVFQTKDKLSSAALTSSGLRLLS